MARTRIRGHCVVLFSLRPRAWHPPELPEQEATAVRVGPAGVGEEMRLVREQMLPTVAAVPPAEDVVTADVVMVPDVAQHRRHQPRHRRHNHHRISG